MCSVKFQDPFRSLRLQFRPKTCGTTTIVGVVVVVLGVAFDVTSLKLAVAPQIVHSSARFVENANCIAVFIYLTKATTTTTARIRRRERQERVCLVLL